MDVFKKRNKKIDTHHIHKYNKHKPEKEVASLEAKKAKADAKAAEAEVVLKKLLAGGMSADEILEKLK